MAIRSDKITTITFWVLVGLFFVLTVFALSTKP